MSEIYAFLFCFALGIAARFLYMATTKLAERTNILPVTIVLDIMTVAAVGGGLTAYIILTDTVPAPYMFTALLAAYLITYLLTRRQVQSGTPEKGGDGRATGGKSAAGGDKKRRKST
ncbi:MAG: hypothetical protein NC184_01855 [Roseburia sp.]|nr:hypothetical protein [Roseburia sp.]